MLNLPEYNKKLEKLTYIDLFAGIGGFRLALDSFGARCVFTSEWDKHAQEVYKKLSFYYTNSTSARINSSNVLSYITSTKIDAWKDDCESFIINCQDQIRICESLVNSDSHFSDTHNKNLLANEVASNPSLRVVKD